MIEFFDCVIINAHRMQSALMTSNRKSDLPILYYLPCVFVPSDSNTR